MIKHEEKEFLWKTIESFQHFLEWKWQVGVFYLVNVTFLLVLTRRIRTVPWHMVFTAIGILVGWLSSTDRIPFHPRTLFDTYGAIPLTLIQFPNFDPNLFLNSTLFKSAFGTAFIAILETLISARMADEMTRKTDHVQSREVFGLAAANLASGIFGGVPATAALARTSLNVRSGARTRLSALLAPLCLLVISFGLLDLFRFVPMVTIASVLTVVGINMIDFGHFKHLWELDRFMFGVGILTAIVCIVEDTMMGLVVGSLISMLAFSGEVAVGHCEMLLTEGKNPVAFIDVAKLDAQKLTRIKLVGPAILAFQQQNPFPAVHSRTWSSSGSEAAPSRIPSSDDRRLLAQGPITYGSIESGAVASPTTPTVTTPLLAPDSVTVAVSGPPVLRVRTPGGSKSGKQIPPTLPLRAYNASTADRTPIIGRRPSIYPAGPDENRRPLSTDYKADTLIYHFAGSLTWVRMSYIHPFTANHLAFSADTSMHLRISPGTRSSLRTAFLPF